MGERLRFYTDEHFPGLLVQVLRSHGIDVLTAAEAGMSGSTDLAHLRFATSQGRVVITYDDDFLVLHTANPEHAGIAYCHQRIPRRRQIERLVLMYYALEPSDIAGRLEFL